MDFNFPHKSGIGIAKFLSHVSFDCVDLIQKMLAYNPDERCSAKQALSHPYFRDLVEQELKMSKMPSTKQNLMMSFHNDSMSFIKGYNTFKNL